MFRKALYTLAIAMVFGAAACNNSIVGPTGTRSDNGDPIRPPAELEKVCLIDLRAVEITSPTSSDLVNGGDLVTISWEAREYCSGFTSEAKVSYDGGATFQSLGSFKQGVSAAWRVPTLDGVRPIIEVTVDDMRGDVRSDRVALASGIVTRPNPPQRDPAEMD